MIRILSLSLLAFWGTSPLSAADYVKLVHVESKKVLSVADKSEEPGAKIVLAKDNGGDVQQWKLEKDGDHLKIVNRKTGKVLDVFEASVDEDAAIIQWDEKGEDNANQRWSWDGDAKAKERRLKSKSSSYFLSVDKEGNAIQKKADKDAKGQLWEVVEVKAK